MDPWSLTWSLTAPYCCLCKRSLMRFARFVFSRQGATGWGPKLTTMRARRPRARRGQKLRAAPIRNDEPTHVVLLVLVCLDVDVDVTAPSRAVDVSATFVIHVDGPPTVNNNGGAHVAHASRKACLLVVFGAACDPGSHFVA